MVVMELVASKSRVLGDVIRRIVRCCHSGITVPSTYDECTDLVNTFNALALPKGFVHVNAEAQVHLVRFVAPRSTGVRQAFFVHGWSMGMLCEFDFVWDFDQLGRKWYVVKDRSGVFERLCPIVGDSVPTLACQDVP